ncbi:guanine nucleotide exchange factor for adp ribosylation factors [Trichoderma arundinaceum]|uniref:Guanine nucleotide exchange factor for adp ribosylation factors n=1 Tax=Trichoderma arundinaceum TaxID=490622 RepID=A0A395NAE9_TRIAR|nr:guanine nucleotide exchange factor for adp ribosylation factors [Trichoderma arundinaceum]
MIAGFGKLRHEITGVQNIHSFDAPTLLAPFLFVIQEKGTAAPITILALGALRKFLAYGFISAESPRFALAMQSLSAAVTHCQFDISDSAQGEVVLLMILNLMEDMMSGPGGYILSDESVCDMMGRGLAICSQPRFSPVLRRTAEAVLVRMCQIIFEDIKHLEIEAGDDSSVMDQLADQHMDNVKMDTTTDSTGTVPIDPAPVRNESPLGALDSVSSEKVEGGSVDNPTNEENGESDTESVDLRPYSLPSVRELFRVLVNFLDPNDRHHTDTMRVVALRIIHVALEVSGSFIARHPALATIAKDQLCCYLFQLVRSDNMAILQESLTVAGTLLATCRGVLKLQQELFLSYLVACLHPTIHIPREAGIDPSLYSGIPETPKLVKPPPSQSNSGRSTPIPVKDRQKLGLEGGARKPDARQAMVEAIGVLSRMPTFAAELFVNYDCDEDRSDLCEDVIGLLSRNALPDSATWSTTSVPPLCLDALLRFVQFMAERVHDDPAFEGLPDPEMLRERRRRKKTIIIGTSKFNEKPKLGLSYLEANNIITNIGDPVSVAKFLKGTSRISKAVLGDFLSKKGNEAILGAFMELFDFSGKRIDQALRVLLETFRLPGEAPLIASVVESFSEKYCDCNTLSEVANKDAVFILTYAIIILNTDQHNPNVKSTKRMTLNDFSRNLRGQNNGQDFSAEYLKDIYECIKSNEIILPDEHDNQHAFDYAWRELLLKSETAGHLSTCDTNIYDGDMFAATWKPVVSTLSYVFMSATDDAVFARIVTGFDECARIATKYGNVEALDQIVYCLSHITTLATRVPFNTSLNTEVQVGDGSVMVSELAVKLGRDFRAQLAVLVLFRVVIGSEALIHHGWKHIIQIWIHLFLNSLAPPLSSTDLQTLPIPAIPLQTPSQVIDRAARSNDIGFFSAFTSYISSYAADDPPEPSDEELESTLCTVDCINSCNIDKVLNNISKLPAARIDILVQALLEQLPQNDHSAVIGVKQDNVTVASTNGPIPSTSLPSYDPTAPFILELCTILTIRDDGCTATTAKQVLDAVHGILRDYGQWHGITVSRAAFYGLMILKSGYDLLLKTADVILSGLSVCTRDPGPLRSEMMTSPDFWVILRAIAGDANAAAQIFDILERSTTGTPPAIIADNYEAAISLLNHFASTADPLTSRDSKALESTKRDIDPQVVARGCQAVNTLHGMTSRIPQLMQQSHLESSEEVFSSDRDGMSEMRVQVASLLCKVFLQYMVLLSEWDGMLDLWIKIIEIMDRLMNSGQGDSLAEAVRENLKNVVLFMATSGYLVSPDKDPSRKKLWDETWERVNRFLPDLRNDILNEENPEPEQANDGAET